MSYPQSLFVPITMPKLPILITSFNINSILNVCNPVNISKLLAAFQNTEQWAKYRNSAILSFIHQRQKLLEMRSQRNHFKVTEISLHQNPSREGRYKIFSTWKTIIHRLKEQRGHLNLPYQHSLLCHHFIFDLVPLLFLLLHYLSYTCPQQPTSSSI